MAFKVFVGGLNSQQTERDLRNYFRSFGPLKAVKVVRDDDQLSLCYGFIWLIDQATRDAILQTERHVIGGRVVDVNTVNNKSKLISQRRDSLRDRKLFVGGLAQETDSETLHRFFTVFGTVRSTFIIYEPRTQISKRFGYVEFSEGTVASQVLACTDLVLDGFNISCRKFGEKACQTNYRRKCVAPLQSIEQSLSAVESETGFALASCRDRLGTAKKERLPRTTEECIKSVLPLDSRDSLVRSTTHQHLAHKKTYIHITSHPSPLLSRTAHRSCFLEGGNYRLNW